jgi:hypothetical protein
LFAKEIDNQHNLAKTAWGEDMNEILNLIELNQIVCIRTELLH